jgi:hypothetical protein
MARRVSRIPSSAPYLPIKQKSALLWCIRDILRQVRGIGAIWAGPGDMSVSMGLRGQASHPAVQATSQRFPDRSGRGTGAFGRHRGRPVLADGCHRLMRLEERANPLDGAGFQLRRLRPGINRHLGVRRQRSDIHGGLVRVCGSVVRQD